MSDGRFALHLGDCIEVMRTLTDASVDSIVTDPPYHLTQVSRGSHARTSSPETPHGRARIGDKGFMGKVWDGGDIAHRVEMWAECLRVLKPGGHLLAFSGTRTQHRMVCAIEDAGFEVRDQIGWLYGSGFPKSRNLDGDWQGWGTALKPAWEPICVARKPLSGTVAANVLQHGTGALNIDACRIGWPDGVAPSIGTPAWGGPAKKLTAAPGQAGETVERAAPNTLGRWPANIIHDGSPEVLEQFPDAPGQMAAQRQDGASQGNAVYGALRYVSTAPEPRVEAEKSAARFFYCAKASRADRHEGLEMPGQAFTHGGHMREVENLGADRGGNHHPTVKPTDLMAYLCRLVTPPSGTVLDPFMGSGSTGKAAVHEGFKFIGIDMMPEYAAIAEARIKFECQRIDQAEFERTRQPGLALEIA